MADLVFECLDGGPERYAAEPTLRFRLRVTEPDGGGIHAIALRCQMRIEPQRRRYTGDESELLADLFGETARWGETLKPLQFANIALLVPSFTGTTEVDLDVPCTYDLEVAAGKYFASLDEGEIPLLLLFSGSIFVKTEGGFMVQQVPWHCETRFRLPVAAWREMMDRFFPGAGWLRLHRDTLRALHRFKSDQGLATWDETMLLLLKRAGEASS